MTLARPQGMGELSDAMKNAKDAKLLFRLLLYSEEVLKAAIVVERKSVQQAFDRLFSVTSI